MTDKEFVDIMEKLKSGEMTEAQLTREVIHKIMDYIDDKYM